MEFLVSVAAWFADPARWSGPDAIPTRVLEHVAMSGTAVATAAILALPAGVWLGHLGRGGFLAINVAGIGRALPSLALLGLALPLSLAIGWGLGFAPTFMAMVPLALPPILTNSYVGLRGVDRDVVEAARGMGMRGDQVLRRIELPLAAPLIVGGLRTAAVAVVATATLGAVVAGPGLGRYIVDGFALREHERVFAGGLLVALLAVGTELAFGLLERVSRHTGTGRET